MSLHFLASWVKTIWNEVKQNVQRRAFLCIGHLVSISQFLSFTPSSFSPLFFSPFTSTVSSHPQIKTQSAKGPLGVCGKASPHLSSSHPGPVLPLAHLSPPPPQESLSPFLLLLHPFSLSPSHFLSIFRSLSPTNYLQDYRFSVGCDWVSLGVMQALRCLLNGEHHELWTNYSQSSTTPESQADTISTHTQAHTHPEHTPAHTHTQNTHPQTQKLLSPKQTNPCAKTRTHTSIVLKFTDTRTHKKHTHDLMLIVDVTFNRGII